LILLDENANGFFRLFGNIRYGSQQLVGRLGGLVGARAKRIEAHFYRVFVEVQNILGNLLVFHDFSPLWCIAF
jgi:hypothetical protein